MVECGGMWWGLVWCGVSEDDVLMVIQVSSGEVIKKICLCCA